MDSKWKKEIRSLSDPFQVPGGYVLIVGGSRAETVISIALSYSHKGRFLFFLADESRFNWNVSLPPKRVIISFGMEMVIKIYYSSNAFLLFTSTLFLVSTTLFSPRFRPTIGKIIEAVNEAWD